MWIRLGTATPVKNTKSRGDNDPVALNRQDSILAGPAYLIDIRHGKASCL
jgi:hypothetical protein